ncbi:MAG: hypothetical protein IT378_11355 [Sandaracinaceae bacterium]|nr:hypothetical protein [Sandaracinaceae bacterium]
MGLELLRIRPGVSVGRAGRVLVLAYQEAPTADDLKRREPMLARLVSESGAVAFLSVIDARGATALPDAESRAETARQLELYGHAVRAGGVVVRGDSLRVSLLRTLLRGLFAVRRSPFPHRFFAEIEPAARFVLDRLGDPSDGDVAELARAAEAVELASRE